MSRRPHLIATAACLLGLAAGLPAAAAAQAAPAPGASAGASAARAGGGLIRIAVIDTEKILLSSQAGKKAVAELKKLQEQKEAEIRAKSEEIKSLQDKATNGKLALAEDKIAELNKQIEDRVIMVRRMQDDATRELNKRKDDLLGSIDEKVMPVINQAGKELGYTLIFRKFESGLIYADEGLDITNQIIQRLDSAQGK
jgi:outer membrane protein